MQRLFIQRTYVWLFNLEFTCMSVSPDFYIFICNKLINYISLFFRSFFYIPDRSRIFDIRIRFNDNQQITALNIITCKLRDENSTPKKYIPSTRYALE